MYSLPRWCLAVEKVVRNTNGHIKEAICGHLESRRIDDSSCIFFFFGVGSGGWSSRDFLFPKNFSSGRLWFQTLFQGIFVPNFVDFGTRSSRNFSEFQRFLVSKNFGCGNVKLQTLLGRTNGCISEL